MERPAQTAKMLLLSFAVAIVIGTLLLSLPMATVEGFPDTGLIDALFTATSATCVTGLIVVDTGTHFTLFGQAVILVLIQLGGLGIMTYSVFLGLVLGRGAGLWQRDIVRDSFGAYSGTVSGLVLRIVLLVLGMEAIGTVLLYLHWHMAGENAGTALWLSVFHSISAFCNAGFSTFSNSMTEYRGDLYLNGVIMFLVVSGGLGFVALFEIPRVLRLRPDKRRWSIHTRTVVTASAWLLISGMTVIYLLESTGVFSSMGGAEGILAALFQSAVARTAGFNSIEIGALRPATLLVIATFMFVGASPGSTGGGIKTTTAVIFFTDLVSYLRGRPTELWERKISREMVEKGYLIITLSAAMVVFVTFVLMVLEPHLAPMDLFFEVTSALGTVGLSTGITDDLSPAGRLLISAAMFAGRVGPLTVALAVGGKRSKGIYEYPEGNIFVG